MATVWVSKCTFKVDLNVRPGANIRDFTRDFGSGYLGVDLDVATERPPVAGGTRIECTDAERAQWIAAGERLLEALEKVDMKFQHAHGELHYACTSWFRRMLVLLIWLPLARLPTKYVVSAIATQLCRFRVENLDSRYRPVSTELRKRVLQAYGI